MIQVASSTSWMERSVASTSRSRSERHNGRSVDQYNRKHKDIEFKVGDMVYINHRNWKTRRPTPKLDTRFAGPYPVQERPTIPSLPDEDLDFEVEALMTSVHTMGLQSVGGGRVRDKERRRREQEE
ncbi:hypothetical protein NDA10_000083 [Ustilago hordei]|nr:hypothetical protein NDA10_000083 [Ustilago hordei]